MNQLLAVTAPTKNILKNVILLGVFFFSLILFPQGVLAWTDSCNEVISGGCGPSQAAAASACASQGGTFNVIYQTGVCEGPVCTSDSYIYMCDVPSAPACAANNGQTCWTAENGCGQVNWGTYNCSGTCSVSSPPPTVDACSANPGIQCSASECTAPPPPPPPPSCVANQGASCSSSANVCGMTNSGSVQCDGSCSASTPSNASCPVSQPDLSAAGVSPSSAYTAVSVTLQSTVTNGGSASVPAGFSTLFQRATSSGGTGTTDIGTHTSASTLSAGGTMNATLSYAFPSAGTWFVRACADKSSAASTGTVTESNESNNCGAWSSVTVTAVPAGALATMTANPGVIASGQSSTLTYSCANSTSASITPTPGAVSPVAAGSVTVSPTAPTNYILTCTGPGGTSQAPAFVNVSSVAQPNLTISGNVGPGTAIQGTAQTFSATVLNNGSASTGAAFTNLFQRAATEFGTNATDIGTRPQPAVGASASAITSLSYTFPASGTWYLRTCADKNAMGDWGIITESNENDNCSPWAMVIVAPASGTAPTATLSGDPIVINVGQSTTLTWSSTNATSCTGYGFNTGGATSGSVVVSPTNTYSYSLSCTGAGGTVNAAPVTITVLGTCGGASSGVLTATPSRVNIGGTSRLDYSTHNVPPTETCTLSGPGLNQSFSPSGCNNFPPPVNVTVNTQSIYTLSCPSLPSTLKVIVNVIPKFEEF